jgi:hypothetical protein
MQKIDETGIRQYLNVMVEIKKRSRVLYDLMSGKNVTAYRPTTVETMGLQFRKIFELIAFASLSANKKLYAQAYANFAKHWEASKLIGNLKRLNPTGFYPKPVDMTSSEQPNIALNFSAKTKGFLTPEDLILAHGRCGSLMHAANPYGKKIDYDFYDKNFGEWYELIVALLNKHEVRLADDPQGGFWLVQMNDFSTDDVSCNFFEFHSVIPSN